MATNTLPEPLLWGQTFFAVLAFGFALTALVVAWLGKASKDWLQAKGIILESEVHRLPGKPKYFPRIKYQYQVNRRSFKSRILFIGHFLISYSETYAQNMIGQYPPNLQTPVFYNPSYPRLSVLEPGINKKVISNLIFRMIICLVCFGLLNPSLLKTIMSFFSI